MASVPYRGFFRFPVDALDKSRLEKMSTGRLVVALSDIGLDDLKLVGGKNASLGELYNALSGEGVRVPDGFVISTQAYEYFLAYNNLTQRITRQLAKVHPDNLSQVARAGRRIRGWIETGGVPPSLQTQIYTAYKALEAQYGRNTDVAVRSSAAFCDRSIPDIEGQQDTLLNIKGLSSILSAFRHVFASLFSDRAIVHRAKLGLDAASARIAVGVQKMVRSDLGASGVMSTIDPETGSHEVIYIASAYGLGDHLSSGAVEPDEFYVSKAKLGVASNPVIKRELGEKATRRVYRDEIDAPSTTHCARVPRAEALHFSLHSNEIIELAHFGRAIERHYSKRFGKPTAMDIEWAKDGVTGQLFIVQASPEALLARKNQIDQTLYQLEEPGWILVSGPCVGGRIVSGKARVIMDPLHMDRLRVGEILVTDATDERWETVLHRAAAIVTNLGGRSGHAARQARIHGIPAVIGCRHATRVIRTGMDLTVSCADRDHGQVYEGILSYSGQVITANPKRAASTSIQLSIVNPNRALAYSRLPVDGAGLVKLEYIIWHNIGLHPRAILEGGMADSGLQQEINELCQSYGGRREYYVQRLMEGIAMVAASFYPRPVTVRFSDFKSDEYAALKGGELFEDSDANPLLGFRGAARFLSSEFAESFSLECEAIRRVREEMGFDNCQVMVPFVRTRSESRELLQSMRENGLRRGENGLKVLLMCETPANVLLADEFVADYDGFMIGVDDLTQLTVGIDGGSRKLKHYADIDMAVLKLILLAIRSCREKGKFVGVCGAAPGMHPEVTSWLVSKGIDVICTAPEYFARVQEAVLKVDAEQAASIDEKQIRA